MGDSDTGHMLTWPDLCDIPGMLLSVAPLPVSRKRVGMQVSQNAVMIGNTLEFSLIYI